LGSIGGKGWGWGDTYWGFEIIGRSVRSAGESIVNERGANTEHVWVGIPNREVVIVFDWSLGGVGPLSVLGLVGKGEI